MPKINLKFDVGDGSYILRSGQIYHVRVVEIEATRRINGCSIVLTDDIIYKVQWVSDGSNKVSDCQAEELFKTVDDLLKKLEDEVRY